MIQTVIKHTQTIAEYKQVKQDMLDNAAQYEAAHRSACEDWQHGDAVKTWYDDNGTQCISYTDGQWWHYKATTDGIEWW